MPKRLKSYGFQAIMLSVLLSLGSLHAFSQHKDSSSHTSGYGPNDTIVTAGILYNGEFMPYKMMEDAYVFRKMTDAQR